MSMFNTKFNTSNEDSKFTDVKSTKTTTKNKIKTNILASGFVELADKHTEVESGQLLQILDEITEETQYVAHFDNFKIQLASRQKKLDNLNSEYTLLETEHNQNIREKLALEQAFDAYKKAEPQKVEYHTIDDAGAKFKNLAQYRAIVSTVLFTGIPVIYIMTDVVYTFGYIIFIYFAIIGIGFISPTIRATANAKFIAKSTVNLATNLMNSQKKTDKQKQIK